MTAPRISVEGDAIEVSGRFASEAEIDAFVARLWTVFFAVHPPAEGAESAAAPIELPRVILAPLPTPVRADVTAIQENTALHHGDVPHKAGYDAVGVGAGAEAGASATQGRLAAVAAPSVPPTQAFAQLSPQERRAVLLMRKYRDRNKVADEMEISANTVSVYLSTARRKGVAA